jgi:hypothetical protein
MERVIDLAVPASSDEGPLDDPPSSPAVVCFLR